MTRHTNSNNIKPMLGFITQMMMILCCIVFATIMTQRYFWGSNAIVSYSVINSTMSFIFFWMIFSVLFSAICPLLGSIVSLVRQFPLFTFIIFSISLSMYFTALLSLQILLGIFRNAYFTFSCVPIWFVTIFVKLRKQFDLLASRTSFVCDLFSHNFSLITYK